VTTVFKAMILLTRHDDMSSQEFRDWWLNQHAPLAKQLPDVRRITFNVVDAPNLTAVGAPGGPVDGQVDGIAELWFDSQAAFEAAYASDLGRQVVADSMAHVSHRVRLFVDEQPFL
jgi:uncharacterized protein (TIGR02118 family)